MATKFKRMMAFETESPPTLVTIHNSHMTNKKHYISISTRLVATEIDKVMAYDIEPLVGHLIP